MASNKTTQQPRWQGRRHIISTSARTLSKLSNQNRNQRRKMERIIYGDETLMAAASCFKMLLPTPFPNAGVHFNKPPPILFTAPPPDPTLDALSSDPTRNPRYKTEICRNFKERARCIYGDQVIFRLLYFHYLLNFNIMFTTLICSSFIINYLVICNGN